MPQTDIKEPENSKSVLRTLFELAVFLLVSMSVAFFFNLFEVNILVNVILSLAIATLFHHEIIDEEVKK